MIPECLRDDLVACETYQSFSLLPCTPQTSLTETMETMEGNMGIESATQEKGGGRSKNFLGVSKKVLSKGTGQDILFFGSSVK